MIALKIDDIRQFTSKLFVGEVFDRFLVKEASIVTFNSFTIDGRVRQGYYTEEEVEAGKIEELSFWKVVKPFCFSLIKGKKLPGSFRIVLQLDKAAVSQFLQTHQLSMEAESVNGLYINIRYEEGKLHCITGTSVTFFTMDKTLENVWDENVKEFLKYHQIVFEEE